MAETAYSFLEQAAEEARQASRRYWAKGGEADLKHPVQPPARSWQIETPPDPELYVNPRGVRVLAALVEHLELGDIDAAVALAEREIRRAPE